MRHGWSVVIWKCSAVSAAALSGSLLFSAPTCGWSAAAHAYLLHAGAECPTHVTFLLGGCVLCGSAEPLGDATGGVRPVPIHRGPAVDHDPLRTGLVWVSNCFRGRCARHRQGTRRPHRERRGAHAQYESSRTAATKVCPSTNQPSSAVVITRSVCELGDCISWVHTMCEIQ